MLELTFADDELLLPECSGLLHLAYTRAPADYRELSPDQPGVRRVGHCGLFKPAQEQDLRPQVLQWFEERAAASAPAR